MRTVVLTTCLALHLSLSARAQSPVALGDALKAAPAPVDAAFSIERQYTRVRFESDGRGRRETTYSVKVLDEQAVREFGEVRLFYQSETEDLTISAITVEKPDGSVTPTPSSDVRDISPIEGPVFVDLRQKVVSVRALRPGDVLRIEAVWIVKKPIAPGHFWFDYSFNANDLVRDEQLEIDVPADRPIALKVAAGGPAEEHGGAGAASGDRRIYRWKTSHREIETKEPAHLPGDDLPPSDVRVSSFRNWDDFAAWYTPLAFAKPDSTVKAKAEALIAGALDDSAKVAAIYRFVSTEIRYVSLSFGIGRFAAHAPADVLKNQYGDCKDKAVLLGALLAAAGVKVMPVLLGVGRSIEDDFASPLEFDHMIALVPKSSAPDVGTWMDPTMEVAPLGMLNQLTRGKRVLLLDGTGHATIVRSPSDPPFPVVTELSLVGSVNSIGVLSAKASMTFRGDAEITLRSALRALPRAMLKDFVAGFAKMSGIDGEVSDATTSDPADTREPFRVDFTVRRASTLDWAAERSELNVPLKLLLENSKPEDRKDLHKIVLGAPGIQRLTAAIELPSGYEASAPTAVAVSRAGLDYKSRYSVSGRQIRLERELSNTVRDIPESAFGEFSAMAGAIEADNVQTFKVRGAVADAPAIPLDATRNELYAAGNAAWRVKRYAAAAALFKRATEVDPKMGDAWIGLGLAYNQLEKYDEAEAAVRQQIALDPFNKRAFADLGFVLKDAGKTAEAAAAYAKHVELNPLDGAAFKELGGLYKKLNRFADQAAALEKAVSLLTPDAWIFTDLGSAYLALANVDKARHAFDRATEIEPTPEIWTKISWQFAEAHVDLDRAEELGRKSAERIAAETATLELKSLTDDHLTTMETLAWTWDALGWVLFQRGDFVKAEEYVRAAWLLGGYPATAFHLGQIAEKREKLADALSFYLTAQAMTDRPTPEMIDRVKRLAGGGDLKLMLDYARRMAYSDRIVRLGPKSPTTKVTSANFLVIVDNRRRAADVRFEDGDQSVRSVEAGLRSVTYPLDFPGKLPARLAVGVKVACDAQQACTGLVEYPTRVQLKK
jgi:tetratricopeptide (TPR) repeat protein/transglutaminase-like putative cysteine protease